MMMKYMVGLILFRFRLLVCTEGLLLPTTRSAFRLLKQTELARLNRPSYLSMITTITRIDESSNNSSADVAAAAAAVPTPAAEPRRRRSPQLPLPDHSTDDWFLRSARSSSITIQAAAAVTQESCQLLGVKSVGVDYGLVRTGVAVTVGYDPKPLAILTDLNTTQVSQHVVRYCQAEQASRVIVGLPLHKNGTVAEQTNLTLQFSQELAKHVLCQLGPGVPVLLWDERYTSKEAAARAHSRDPGRYLYGTLDADSACIILEYYYKDNGLGAVQVDIENQDVRWQCLEEFNNRQREEQSRRKNAVDEREYRIQQRKEAIARAMKAEADKRATNEGDSTKKRRKKRKRKC